MTYDQIWLIGFSGTGKSRLVRALAAALDWEAVDLDQLIEARAEQDIPGIFRTRGETAFREMEAEALEETAQRTRVVVATGGGAVLSERNRAAMHRRGFVACLDARPETILERLQGTGAETSERPLLQGGDPIAKIIEIKSARQPLYAQSDFIIQTDDMTPDQVTHQILLAFRERTAVAGSTA
jgi:shikimate kinase